MASQEKWIRFEKQPTKQSALFDEQHRFEVRFLFCSVQLGSIFRCRWGLTPRPLAASRTGVKAEGASAGPTSLTGPRASHFLNPPLSSHSRDSSSWPPGCRAKQHSAPKALHTPCDSNDGAYRFNGIERGIRNVFVLYGVRFRSQRGLLNVICTVRELRRNNGFAWLGLLQKIAQPIVLFVRIDTRLCGGCSLSCVQNRQSLLTERASLSRPAWKALDE